jgi:PAS domain S-box-containing protein
MRCEPNHRQMTDLVRASMDAIVVLDTEGVVVFANPAAEALLGKAPGGAAGYHLGCPVADSQPFEVTFRRDQSDPAIVEMHAVETVWDGQPAFVVNLHDITLKKRAFEQNQLLAAIVQSTQDAVISKTLDGAITSWNHGAQRIYGYGAEEMIGRNIDRLVPNDMENDLPAILEKIRAGETVDTYETVRRTKHGKRLNVSLTVSPVNDQAGSIIGAASIARDVTESRKARLELEQALARVDHLNQMLHTIRQINLLIAREKYPAPLARKACDIIAAGQGFEAAWIVLQDESEGVRSASQAGFDDLAISELFAGFKAGRLPPCCTPSRNMGQPAPTVNPKENCPLCPLAKTLPAATAFTSQLHYEGKHFGYLNTCVPVHFDDDAEIRGLIQEISEDLSFALQGIENEQARREAENQLRKDEQLLNETGEMARVGGWEIDLGTELVAWTQSTRKIHEAPDDYEPTLEEALNFFVPEAREMLTKAIRRAREEEVPFDLELAFITAKGNRLWTRVICQPEFQDGTCVRLHGTFQDITELKAALDERLAIQEQFQQVQKLESIGLLAGGVSHDFNNMLSVILGYGEELLDKLHEGDPLREAVEEIVSAGRRSADLTRQLLAFSRKQTLQVEVLDINAVVSNLEKMLRRLIGEDIALKTRFAEQLSRVKVDPGQIEQVILNLAVNARDAMPQGGKLTLETANVELDEHYAQNRVGVVPGQYVQLSVTDTGCGMDAATRERLFEPFFTTKDKGRGTGLGLSTVYGIVKQSGGNIWVYSEPGQGTTFKIYLPCTTDAQTARAATQADASIKGRAEKILVIEDEPSLRKLCATILKRANYQVTAAANGGEALLLVEESKLRPDLVITDVVMPGMSGKVLVDRLKKLLPDLKVLYMSGYTDNAIVHHGVLDSGTPFIQKPFEKGDLERKTRELLNG